MTNYEYTISSSNYTTAHTIEMTTSDTVTITGVTDVENIYGLYNSDPTANAPTGAPTGYQTSAYWSVSKTVTNSGSDYNGRMFNTNGAISLPVGTHTFITSRRCLISEDEFKKSAWEGELIVKLRYEIPFDDLKNDYGYNSMPAYTH